MSRIKTVQVFIYKNLVWIFIALSLVFIIVSKLNWFENDTVNYIFEKLGIALFSSGVFAAVLKAIQFTGIFREEIEKVILGTNFVKNRRDLPELWRTVSKAMYNEKFPEISEKIESRIMSTYLPTEYLYYYKNLVFTLDIHEITEDFDIIYTQTMKYDVVPDIGVDKIKLYNYIEINEIHPSANHKNELVFYKVNNEDAKLVEDDTFHPGNNFKQRSFVELSGKGPFKVYTQSKRCYSLKDENYKLIRLKTFTRNVDVTISFPENVGVSFFNIGNAISFDTQHVGLKNQISRSHNGDILLPHQGFGLTFERR